MVDGSKRRKGGDPDRGGWVRTELESLDLGDKRLNERARKILGMMGAHPQSTLPQAMGTWKDTKAAYRFISNGNVSHEKILEAHAVACRRRIRGETIVLAVQDTTELNYTDHPAAQDLGTIGSSDKLLGMHVHTTMAFTPQGVPLGILDQQTWIRPREEFGKRETRHDKSIEEKESYKWLHSLKITESVQKENPDVVIINVGDREADVYDLFLEASRSATEMIVRASWDRRVDHEENHLWAHMEAQTVAATSEMEVPVKKTKKFRQASLELRFASVTLRPPGRRAKEKLSPISLYVVYLHEPNPPEGTDAISWMLLTTALVNSPHEAFRIVQYYIVRWSIEVFHRILKTGCGIEKRQLQTADRLRTCLALDSLVAWRIQLLTMLARDVPDLPCDAVFEEHEWKALYCFVYYTTQPPAKPPSLAEAVAMIGSVGGFLARKSDRHPGPAALWRGLQQLAAICWAWFAFGPGHARR